MSEKFNPNWDPKKHDMSVEKQPKISTARLACKKCKGTLFELQSNITVVISNTLANAGIQADPENIKCSKCGAVTDLGGVINSVRESVNKQDNK